ncbi:melanoma-associated antigen B4-like [Peromyscus leucopus]|uniref:melanoma-associated antigen B4-like n=1 Tax=Peromyscus leucopus TaxID=10041 RepID=UPI0010A1AD9A|nr:melanoma-associated antigen B4-like [Peromyscus leucopus]
MPRGKKSKARAREKRRQVQDEAQGLNDAQTKASEKGESRACADQASGDAKPSTPAGVPLGKTPNITASNNMALQRSGKGAKGQGENNESSFRAPLSTGSMQMDLLSRKTGLLVEYMLCKYKIKQPAKRGEMLKVINKRFKEQFPEILKKASYRLDMVFGIELKEIQPNGQSYMLISKLDFQDDGSRSNELGLPNRGILIPLLSVIYLNNYCASEEEIWHFLNMLGIYDGVPHLIFGDVRKLITEELVQEKYLEYRRVLDGDPPSYQFLWGPRAYTETSKMKVMDFLAKVSETMPSAYSSLYEKALIEEEEKAKEEAAAKPGTKGKAKGHTKTKLGHATHK